MKVRNTFYIIFFTFLFCTSISCEPDTSKSSNSHGYENYSLIQDSLQNGWGSWNTHDVLSFSYLPDGLDVNLDIIIQSKNTRQSTPDLFFGIDYNDIQLEVTPVASSIRGDYSAIKLVMGDLKVIIESGSAGKDFVLHIKSLNSPVDQVVLIVAVGILWNNKGYTEWAG
ncbi:MAG: hypothetical protein ACP5E3_09375, partial [Bacteroidales bacterium]